MDRINRFSYIAGDLIKKQLFYKIQAQNIVYFGIISSLWGKGITSNQSCSETSRSRKSGIQTPGETGARLSTSFYSKSIVMRPVVLGRYLINYWAAAHNPDTLMCFWHVTQMRPIPPRPYHVVTRHNIEIAWNDFVCYPKAVRSSYNTQFVL